MLHQLFCKDLHYLTGSLDVTPGAVVPAFHHGRHAQHHHILDVHDIRGLLRHLSLQILVVMLDSRRISLFLGSVYDFKKVAYLPFVVNNISDGQF